MLHRVTANFFFDIDDEARDFYHDCTIALAKAITINPDLPQEAHSTCDWEECHHDQPDPTRCVILAHDESP